VELSVAAIFWAVRLAAAKDQFDGAAEWLGHLAFKARGEGFEGRGFGTDQGGRLQIGCFTIAGAGLICLLAHRLLMVTAFGAGFRGGG
jgi:hypothetical protein